MLDQVALGAMTCSVLLVVAVAVWPRRFVPRGRRLVLPRNLPDVGFALSEPTVPPTDQELLTILGALANQLSAGASPELAWACAWQTLAEGKPMPHPLELAEPYQGLAARSLATAWQLAERTGAPLAETLQQLHSSLRNDLELQELVQLELAGPQATARILLILPGFGVLLGEFLGAHPLTVLVATSPGRLSLTLGVGLLLAGHFWMRHWLLGVQRMAAMPPYSKGRRAY